MLFRDGGREYPAYLSNSPPQKTAFGFPRYPIPAKMGFSTYTEPNKEVINKVAANLKPEEVLLGVMTDRPNGYSDAESTATIAKYGHTHPILMANEAFMEAFHGVAWSHVTPVIYIVDGTGRIAGSYRGPQSYETLRRALDAQD